MKVFISWSGEKSRLTALLLSDWIKCVLQATEPWMSQKHIDRGSLWFSEINLQLQDTTVGIVCLTKENQNRPWILFESGALAKGLSSSRVCTFLIDLKTSDLQDPLAQFNHTLPEKHSVRSLVGTLNASLGSNALPNSILDQVFDTYWPKFEQKFTPIKAIQSTIPEVPAKNEIDYLAEILDTTRALGARLTRLEDRRSLDDIKISPSRDWNGSLSRGEQWVFDALNYITNSVKQGDPEAVIANNAMMMGVPASVVDQVMAGAKSKNKLTKREN